MRPTHAPSCAKRKTEAELLVGEEGEQGQQAAGAGGRSETEHCKGDAQERLQNFADLFPAVRVTENTGAQWPLSAWLGNTSENQSRRAAGFWFLGSSRHRLGGSHTATLTAWPRGGGAMSRLCPPRPPGLPCLP